tara:strand:- start:19 stop:585 length:567 start_codon:yes stop_codon:yes gene_type:complete
VAALFKSGIVTLLEGVRVDIKTDELHTMGGQVSRFAREDRAPASDHIVLDPDILEIVCNVGNVPNEPNQGRAERAKTTFDALQKLRASRELFEVMTEHKLYTNMAFLGISLSNSAAFSGAATIRARFEESPSATVETLTVPPSRLSASGGGQTNKTASAEVDAGRQNAETEETADNRSFAAQLLDRQG